MMKQFLPIVALLLCINAAAAQNGKDEPIFTTTQLMQKCSGTGGDRQLCYAYLRGFSDGNRWLIHDHISVVVDTEGAVCIPNREPIGLAADLLVARFKGHESELGPLSPYRVVSIALSSRYSCDKLFAPKVGGGDQPD
jgi:hypothetical protein